MDGMLLTEDQIESSVQLTREFITPIVSSNRGEKDEALKLDGLFFFDVIVVKMLLPIMTAVTSKVIEDKIQNNRSYKELNKALMSLAGSQITPLSKKKKQELVETATQQLGKFGASKEQAQELVEMIVKEINSQAKKHPGNGKKSLKK